MLDQLERPLDAIDELVRSLAFGEAPLGRDAHMQGLIYRQLLDAQLAHVTIGAHEPGMRLTIDA